MPSIHFVAQRVMGVASVLASTLLLSVCAQEVRLDLNPKMVVNEASFGDPAGLVDEQRVIVGPPQGKPKWIWKVDSKHTKEYPVSAYLDLGAEKNVSCLWLFDTHNKGDVVISIGEPGAWQETATYDCGTYMQWARIPLDATTRYVRLTRMTPGAQFTEIAIYEYTPEAYKEVQERKAAEARREAERAAALKKAREEALKRPLVDIEPYGRLSLVEEVDCAGAPSGRIFAESPKGVTQVKTILDRPCRVLPPTKGEAAYFSYRVGRMKLLRPGGTYVLAVDYPQDAPRSMVVINTGNETSRGFHTGPTVGDALHAKYVNSLVESLDVPLSGKWQTWTLLFNLHDRFPERGLVRGSKERPLTPEDGFDVTIAQFSAKNAPMSQGAAVSRIRLFEVLDPDKLTQPLQLPPDGLPRRHLFWREEMSDGLLGGKNSKPEQEGLKNRLDWLRNKADLMHFLGMNTYAKDLLEFGACQHWDPTAYGGNDWVYYDHVTKDLWAQIVELMGSKGLNVLPYYEYAGSKGKKGLGFQRRCKPLTREEAYTHIKWIESSNADITDPDTFEDFKKMLDLTVIRHRSKAHFVGAWLRPRSQLPISFGDGALKRFSEQANGGQPVTRKAIRGDKALYGRYIAWWQTKRREFLTAMRDHLRSNGIDDAAMLYTGCPGEPGVGFHSWKPRMVTDRPDLWLPVLKRPEHITGKKEVIEPITVKDVLEQGLYLQGLTAPGLNWGSWEIQHARPADDPSNYRDVDGVMMTHAFNREYTVSDPKTLDLYTTQTGLALVRHYALNENMMFDNSDANILGYFVADMELTGPYCMLAEALAVANGNPTMIGYLSSNNFGRGFPVYVRNFNANFLALPALPSSVVKGASDVPGIVVRAIPTKAHGTFYALVNTNMTGKEGVSIRLPEATTVRSVVGGSEMTAEKGVLRTDFYPFELKTWHSR